LHVSALLKWHGDIVGDPLNKETQRIPTSWRKEAQVPGAKIMTNKFELYFSQYKQQYQNYIRDVTTA